MRKIAISFSPRRARIITRKRNFYGKAMGDILLPEGQTVMNLVSNSLAKGLRENGFRVLEDSDAEYAAAAPIEVDIEKFWGWFQPGFWQVKLHYVTSIMVSGPVGPFADGVTFSSDVEMGFQIASSGNWLQTINASLDELNNEITATLNIDRAANPE